MVQSAWRGWRWVLRFSVLGNVEVHEGDRPVRISTGRVRTLLVGLLVHANRVVPMEDLAEIMWGDRPPQGVRSAVQLNVVRLRRALGNWACDVGTRPNGYVIELCPSQLDLLRFRRLTADGRASLDLSTRSELFRSALALWRGRPLSDIASDVLQRDIVPSLVDEYLAACEQWAEVELEMGNHVDVIPFLRRATREHPGSENVWAQLMVALYRSGRQGDALEAYRALCRYLDESLGLKPSGPLRKLHEAILRGEPRTGQLSIRGSTRDFASATSASILRSGS
jgi:DNA-binding SARP family transcriptional activator